jgi:uncharacterized protein YutE (UPF0331/DUF86 family)
MSPLSNNQLETIIKRLSFARIELSDLFEYQNISFETYQENRSKRRNLERIIENLFNSASDIAKVIIAGENTEIPETYREAFLTLGRLSLISANNAAQMAEFSRLRNVLAHQYLDIRWEVISEFLKTGIPAINSYLDSIEKFIESTKIK